MINPTNYNRVTMKKYMSVLPKGTMQEIAEATGLTYNQVANACYGKQFNQAVIDEVEKRYKKAKKQLPA